MADEAQLHQELLRRIKARRADVQAFVRHQRPRNTRLSTSSVVFSAVAAILTAGPGLGGEKFTESAQHLFSLRSDSTVWRVLCLGAAGVSVMAAILTNLSKSQENVIRVSAAETCNAELEGLETQIELGQLPVQEAVRLYQQSVAKIPFIHEVSAGAVARSGD